MNHLAPLCPSGPLWPLATPPNFPEELEIHGHSRPPVAEPPISTVIFGRNGIQAAGEAADGGGLK